MEGRKLVAAGGAIVLTAFSAIALVWLIISLIVNSVARDTGIGEVLPQSLISASSAMGPVHVFFFFVVIAPLIAYMVYKVKSRTSGLKQPPRTGSVVNLESPIWQEDIGIDITTQRHLRTARIALIASAFSICVILFIFMSYYYRVIDTPEPLMGPLSSDFTYLNAMLYAPLAIIMLTGLIILYRFRKAMLSNPAHVINAVNAKGLVYSSNFIEWRRILRIDLPEMIEANSRQPIFSKGDKQSTPLVVVSSEGEYLFQVLDKDGFMDALKKIGKQDVLNKTAY